MNEFKINNKKLPKIGQGSWTIGDDLHLRQKEIKAIQHGINCGINLIDTAEMYGNGASELIIGNAIKPFKREEFLITTKILPNNCTKKNIVKSCDESLKRLNINYIDLYLLHWRGKTPLFEIVEIFENLIKTGKILKWGVSNFDINDMKELLNIENGTNCYANQVMYNLASRGIEFDLLPFLKSNNILCMAYCPLLQGGKIKRLNYNINNNVKLSKISKKYNITNSQLALAFLIKQDVMPTVKSSNITHIEENYKSSLIKINESDWDEIDTEFPPPSFKMHLDIE